MDRDSFYGHVAWTAGATTVVSFPGAYTSEWGMLVERSQKLKEVKVELEEKIVKRVGPTPTHGNKDVRLREQMNEDERANAKTVEDKYRMGSTCCVFLPKGSPLFGCHALDPESQEKNCWCSSLYGGRTEFGCKWFQKWLEQLKLAMQRRHRLVVVFKAGEKDRGTSVQWPPKIECTEENKQLEGLGVSQRGEVAYIQRELQKEGLQGYPALEYWDIQEFRQSLLKEIQRESEGLNSPDEQLQLEAKEIYLRLEARRSSHPC